MGTRRLRDISPRVHHGNLCDFLAAFLLAVDRLAMNAHLRVLSRIRTRRSLPARIGVHLRVKYETFDRHARGKHPRERLEADVKERTVTADAPQRLVLPAHLVPP